MPGMLAIAAMGIMFGDFFFWSLNWKYLGKYFGELFWGNIFVGGFWCLEFSPPKNLTVFQKNTSKGRFSPKAVFWDRRIQPKSFRGIYILFSPRKKKPTGMAREGGKHLHQNRRGLEDLVGGWTNFWERRVPNTFSTNRWFQVEIPAIWKELLLQNGFIFPKYRGWNFRSKPPRYQMSKKSGCQGSKCAKAFKNTKNSNLAISKTNEKDANRELPMMNNEKPEGGSRRVAKGGRI